MIRPKDEGNRPTLIIRSPYAFTSFVHLSETYKPLFKHEYAIVLQNERGSEWSEGEFGYLTSTTNDAMDTLDWIAVQDWSNGRVGAHGCSSTAENQLKLGAIGHPALRACVPMSSGAGIGSIPGTEGCQGLFFRGGVPMLGDLGADQSAPVCAYQRSVGRVTMSLDGGPPGWSPEIIVRGNSRASAPLRRDER